MNINYDELNRFKDKNYNSIFTNIVTIGHDYAQRCIVSMVNSGDCTLEQAIYIYGHSCERCINVLLFTYLNEEDGYPEFSDEWKKTNTSCKFCENIAEPTIDNSDIVSEYMKCVTDSITNQIDSEIINYCNSENQMQTDTGKWVETKPLKFKEGLLSRLYHKFLKKKK